MIVVIDGYNLLRQMFPSVRGALDKQRQQFIRQLGFYKKRRGGKLKEIIVVFDGGQESRATREIRDGVTVVFSGQKSSADEWIINYIERNVHNEIVLVTLDRGLIQQCKDRKVEVLNVFEFYSIVQSDVVEQVEQDLRQTVDKREGDDSAKFEHLKNVEQIDSAALDLLMQQSFDQGYAKDDTDAQGKGRKGKAYTMSKKEKKRYEKLKKLW